MTHENLKLTAKALKTSLDGNMDFARDNKQSLESSTWGQAPLRFTHTCIDSRCHGQMYGETSAQIGKTFRSRLAGNFVDSVVIGGIQYAVGHAKTGYLLITGHTGCGAVAASMGDYSNEPEILQSALDAIKSDYAAIEDDIQLKNLSDLTTITFKNVQAQVLKVKEAMKEQVESGQFTVIGTVYDNQGELGDAGLTYIYSINGETDADTIMNHPVMAEVQGEKYSQQIVGWRS